MKVFCIYYLVFFFPFSKLSLLFFFSLFSSILFSGFVNNLKKEEEEEEIAILEKKEKFPTRLERERWKKVKK